MRPLRLAALLVSLTTAIFAQKWEFGAEAGGGFLNTVNVTGTAGSATAGFAPGFVVGAFAGENMYDHLSGEFHYEYMQSNLKLSSGGQSAQFSGGAHAFHYDVNFHSHINNSPFQFFGTVGGGGKVFVGTGAPEAAQPLSQYGYFTKTQSFKGLLTFGAGFTVALGSNVQLRAEVQDFLTGFPNAVLTPPPGVKYGSLLNELVPMVSIVFLK